jgi:hypothetical protein
MWYKAFLSYLSYFVYSTLYCRIYLHWYDIITIILFITELLIIIPRNFANIFKDTDFVQASPNFHLNNSVYTKISAYRSQVSLLEQNILSMWCYNLFFVIVNKKKSFLKIKYHNFLVMLLMFSSPYC